MIMNSIYKLFTLVLVVCTTTNVFADKHHEEHHEPANYKFDYSVYDPHTGDKKQQYEERNGHVVKGAYSLLEPDGTTRIVEYTADPHTGFNAVVKRIGHAHHPHPYQHHHYQAPAHGYHGSGSAHSTVGVTHFGYHY